MTLKTRTAKTQTNEAIKQDNLVLRPYQADIVEQASKAKGSVLVEAPTGAGKTLMALEIAKNEIANGGTVLFIAPKIVLLEQTAKTFSGLDPQIIHGKQKYDKEHNVFVSTLQTAHKRELGFEPTVVMIDEAHYAFTGKMLEQLLKDFKGKLVALSATPYSKDGKPLEGFDTHLNSYDINYMITNSYLVPIISYQPVKVDLKGIRTTAGDFNIGDLDQKFNTIESVAQVVDATKQKILERKQALVFCITIKHAEAMAKAYSSAGVSALATHSQLSKEDQAEAMEAFKSGEVKVMCNVDQLTTGYDHPAADTIVLARATKSQNLYKQMIGRVLRLAPDKTNAILLDCAGVISNLGLPTAPIRPKQEYKAEETKAATCAECGSERVYRAIKEDKAYKVCAECGNHEELESISGYECEACGKIHGNDANFIANAGKLSLSCECGHYTVISEATSHEELAVIFDKQLVETLKRRITAAYCTALISKYGMECIYRAEVKRQLDAISEFIKQHPEQAVSGTMERITEAMSKSPDEWRLLAKHHEDKLLPQDTTAPEPVQDTAALKQSFYNARTFSEAVHSLNMLLEATGKAPLKQWVVDKTVQQINDSFVEGIERMTVKRLKNMYNNGKNCNSIDTFVPYVEKDRRSRNG